MVGDQHELARADLRPQRPGRVREHEDLGARGAQGADGRADRVEVAALVDVRATLEHGDRHVADPAETARPPWPATVGRGKPGQVGVVDDGLVGDGVGDRTEPRAEHDADPRPQRRPAR